MKGSIPDTGTVIRLVGANAVLRMKHDASCSKCGAAALGMCKGGLMRELTVRNSKHARLGDNVKIGLAQNVQYKGYVLAYVVPAIAFLVGIVVGYYLGVSAGIPALDILTGFAFLLVASFFSFRRLSRLDSSNAIEIVDVLSDPWSSVSAHDDERIVSDDAVRYVSQRAG